MAGGKETPRQKMIGMMYLVLTALLALNVSKSILDAFVAIEENIQKANIVQAERGSGFYGDVQEEINAAKGPDQAAKKKKLQYVLGQMDQIEKETTGMIKFLDDMKIEILKEAGENINDYKDKDHNTLLWKKAEGVKPIRMNCAAVQGKDKYDEPMRVMGIAEDIKSPKGNGAELWKRLNDYRSKLVEIVGSYQMPGSEKKFSITPKAINDFENNQQLTKAVTAMVEGSKANLKEDRQVLIDLYMMLSKPEKNEVHGMEGVHWVGMTFDHAPLVAGVAALSSLEQDVLSARALALANYKSKVSTGEYSFNKIMPLAYGPSVANSGDSVTLQVMMAAFDSDNLPDVTVDGIEDATIVKKDGQGLISFRAGSGQMDLTGTVSIKNKSGVKKTEKWEHTVFIMKPSGSIELPEMNVLYRGYNNIVQATASGFDQTDISVTNASKSKSGDGWIVKPGRGATADITVIGRSSASGKSSNLKKATFRVQNLPDPSLFWGGKKSGEKANKNSGLLQAQYGPGIPLKASFSIISWSFQSPQANRPQTGSGSNIGAVSTIIRASKPGSQVGFVCTVRGPDGKTRKIGGTWTI